jgi:DNA polymerase III alpha subunit
MTMLARTATGPPQSVQALQPGLFDGYYRKPRMDRELVDAHSDGIIATTGCPSGEVQTRLRSARSSRRWPRRRITATSSGRRTSSSN